MSRKPTCATAGMSDRESPEYKRAVEQICAATGWHRNKAAMLDDDNTFRARTDDAVALWRGAAFYLRAALDWIDAIPKETADSLPAMPGFDRDAAESILDSAPTSKASDETCAYCGMTGADVCDTTPPDSCERAIERSAARARARADQGRGA